MTGTGFDADPEELRQAATTLRQSCDEIQALTDYTKEADPDWEAWGLCGAPLGGIYFAIASAYRFALGECKGALEGVAGNIERCGDSYQDNDDEIAAAFDMIGGRIEIKGGGS